MRAVGCSAVWATVSSLLGAANWQQGGVRKEAMVGEW